jgi:hypothetical protein
MLGCSIEDILCDINDTGISMVRFARKPIHDGLYGLTPHHFVKDEQMPGIQIRNYFFLSSEGMFLTKVLEYCNYS